MRALFRRESAADAAARPPGQSEAEAVRVRCCVAVLMQRACDAIHADCAGRMPLAVQLQLLSVLQVRQGGACPPLLPPHSCLAFLG